MSTLQEMKEKIEISTGNRNLSEITKDLEYLSKNRKQYLQDKVIFQEVLNLIFQFADNLRENQIKDKHLTKEQKEQLQKENKFLQRISNFDDLRDIQSFAQTETLRRDGLDIERIYKWFNLNWKQVFQQEETIDYTQLSDEELISKFDQIVIQPDDLLNLLAERNNSCKIKCFSSYLQNNFIDSPIYIPIYRQLLSLIYFSDMDTEAEYDLQAQQLFGDLITQVEKLTTDWLLIFLGLQLENTKSDSLIEKIASQNIDLKQLTQIQDEFQQKLCQKFNLQQRLEQLQTRSQTEFVQSLIVNCHLSNDLLFLCAIASIHDNNVKAALAFIKQTKMTAELSKFETTVNVLLAIYYIQQCDIQKAALYFCQCNFDQEFSTVSQFYQSYSKSYLHDIDNTILIVWLCYMEFVQKQNQKIIEEIQEKVETNIETNIILKKIQRQQYDVIQMIQEKDYCTGLSNMVEELMKQQLDNECGKGCYNWLISE